MFFGEQREKIANKTKTLHSTVWCSAAKSATRIFSTVCRMASKFSAVFHLFNVKCVRAKVIHIQFMSFSISHSLCVSFFISISIPSLFLPSPSLSVPFALSPQGSQTAGEMIVSSAKYNVQEHLHSMYESRMTLTIRKFQHDDIGSYRCIAKNSLGEVDSSIRLYGKLCSFNSICRRDSVAVEFIVARSMCAA